MNFETSAEHQAIREAVQDLCTRFPESYWLERDADGEFPHAFYRAMGDAGWLGTAIPEAYGGSDLFVVRGTLSDLLDGELAPDHRDVVAKAHVYDRFIAQAYPDFYASSAAPRRRNWRRSTRSRAIPRCAASPPPPASSTRWSHRRRTRRSTTPATTRASAPSPNTAR